MYTTSGLFYQKIYITQSFHWDDVFLGEIDRPKAFAYQGVKEVEVQTVCFYGSAPKNSDAIISVSGISESILRSRFYFRLSAVEAGSGVEFKQNNTPI